MFKHGGAGLSEIADWLLSFAAGDVGVAIETPRGPVVETAWCTRRSIAAEDGLATDAQVATALS